MTPERNKSRKQVESILSHFPNAAFDVVYIEDMVASVTVQKARSMNIDEFVEKIQEVRSRAASLRQHSEESPSSQPEMSLDAFEELGIALEELRQQNEALEAARQEAEAERQRYRERFEFAPDGYLVTSPEGVIREANRAAAGLLNCSQEFLVGKPMVLFVADGERRAFRSGLNRLSQGEREQAWEMRLQPRNAAPLDAALRVAVVRDPEGRPIALRWLIRDVTERKQAEQEIRRMNAELKAADQLKDQFLAMLAHELRNPLNAILNAVEILKLPGVPEQSFHQALEILERQVHHQAHMLDDLLDLTRIARGKTSLQSCSLDLVRLVRDSAEEWRSAAAKAGLALALDLPKEPVWVLGDPTRLSQVMSNLLDNAVKFTRPGGRVTVRLEANRDPRRAVVAVHDTGMGIAPEMLPYVFETFAQADRSLDRSRGGLGLGLALVKGLVELHGGEVRAHSGGPGRGSEFTLLLPLTPPPAACQTEGVAPASAAAKPLRILVIEDNRDAAELLRLLLERLGHVVEVASSGPAGVEAAQQFRPEAVICDLGLPEMDGYAVAAELRRKPATAMAHLIALSGYGREEDRRRAQAAGFDLHLTKPVRFEDLRWVLRSVVER